MYNYFFEYMFSLDTKMSSDSIVINYSPVEEASSESSELLRVEQ